MPSPLFPDRLCLALALAVSPTDAPAADEASLARVLGAAGLRYGLWRSAAPGASAVSNAEPTWHLIASCADAAPRLRVEAARPEATGVVHEGVAAAPFVRALHARGALPPSPVAVVLGPRRVLALDLDAPLAEADRAALERLAPALGRAFDAADALATASPVSTAEATGLRAALDRAEEAGRLKDAILQNLSHEFRTPLAAILGSAAILQDETPESLHDFTRAIAQGSTRLLHLLDGVMELAHLHAGLIVAVPKPDCAARHARAALAEQQARAAEKGLALVYDGPPAAPFTFDASLLRRLLGHLLGNAVKFTEAGSVTLALDARAEGGLAFEVSDTGIGMDEVFLRRIGTPFEQASSGLTRSHEGAGVGLAVAQGLAALLGTALSVESLPGEGTRVRFVLPVPVGAVEASPAHTPPAEARLLATARA